MTRPVQHCGVFTGETSQGLQQPVPGIVGECIDPLWVVRIVEHVGEDVAQVPTLHWSRIQALVEALDELAQEATTRKQTDSRIQVEMTGVFQCLLQVGAQPVAQSGMIGKCQDQLLDPVDHLRDVAAVLFGAQPVDELTEGAGQIRLGVVLEPLQQTFQGGCVHVFQWLWALRMGRPNYSGCVRRRSGGICGGSGSAHLASQCSCVNRLPLTESLQGE